LFRIDRSFVNLAATRLVQVDNGEENEAGAVGESLYAAASATYMTQAQAQAQEQAQAIIAEANEEAEAIKHAALDEIAALMVSARDQAEADRLRAIQEGYSEGAEDGRRSYDEQLAEKLREDNEMLSRIIKEIYSGLEETYNGLEDEVVALALDIVRKIVNPAEEAIGGVFEPLVRNALKQMAPVEKVILRVSPAEYERFFSSGSALFELESGAKIRASILRDASLSDGDCIIDAEDQTINASLDSQLKYVKLTFEKCKV